MNFRSLASSSSGNAYLVESPGVAPLLLECGLPIKKLREKLSFGITGLAGCLISHEHGDHSKAVDDLLRAGVDCWMSKGTAEVMGWDGHHRCNMFHCTSDGGYRVADIAAQWVVMPFPLEHDAEEPVGFLIEPYSRSNDERLLFVPDTEMVKNRFEDVTILAIECNHEAGLLSDNIVNGAVPAPLGRRIRRNHLSLSVVKDFITANNMQKTLREIHLIHLSNSNSDEERFRREIQSITGVPTYIAGE